MASQSLPVLTVVSLCDGSGAWSQPYRDAGYDVISVEIKTGSDVRLLTHLGPVRGILAAPPCTEFALSGARWWADKGEEPLLEALSIVDACCRIILAHRATLVWWVLENPIGRLRKWLGEPRMAFDPCDYGDNYQKRTQLWGDFREPLMRRALNTEGSRIRQMSSAWSEQRAVTPQGFARAFFEANP